MTLCRTSVRWCRDLEKRYAIICDMRISCVSCAKILYAYCIVHHCAAAWCHHAVASIQLPMACHVRWNERTREEHVCCMFFFLSFSVASCSLRFGCCRCRSLCASQKIKRPTRKIAKLHTRAHSLSGASTHQHTRRTKGERSCEHTWNRIYTPYTYGPCSLSLSLSLSNRDLTEKNRSGSWCNVPLLLLLLCARGWTRWSLQFGGSYAFHCATMH